MTILTVILTVIALYLAVGFPYAGYLFIKYLTGEEKKGDLLTSIIIFISFHFFWLSILLLRKRPRK